MKEGRLAYYQGMLASNNARGSAANISKGKQGAGRASAFSQSGAN